ncbi:GntR family transcriptional regulator [Peptoniphilus sp. KCTC 25270]|uniref:GntR family transcriptional regulator n=1 Tax=Peptoniphilus sp. KCTC 25270 TaxID=2897414 RepID=UPI001E587101|nr:GntR family transcriptional regulator [Peptoniphilus sp. KCTC 25270]MCD1147420.1 GntR family transcriptional regulator [Peptoniphilus sp. KCTC 25270]
MEFNGNQPIYLQLLEEFYRLLTSDEWKPGEKIPSVRQLASIYGVNPNTIQKALQELERENLAISDRTRGRFITEDVALIENLRERSFLEICDQLIQVAEDLKMKPETALRFIESRWNKKEEENHG